MNKNKGKPFRNVTRYRFPSIHPGMKKKQKGDDDRTDKLEEKKGMYIKM